MLGDLPRSALLSKLLLHPALEPRPLTAFSAQSCGGSAPRIGRSGLPTPIAEFHQCWEAQQIYLSLNPSVAKFFLTATLAVFFI